MRSFLLIAGTLALLVGLFIGYTMLQTGRTVLEVSPDTSGGNEVVLPGADREAIVGEGEDAWVEVRDERWQVVSRFRASKYDPRKDGRVQVTQPEAVFFMSDGQRLRIRGREGVVAMSRLPEPGEDPRNIGPSQAPTRGELREVEIELFDSQEAMDADAADQPMQVLRVTLDNAAFDNETFRIFTTDTEIDGRLIPHDRVPVLVTGRDYDFEGEGLTIRWNEKDRRLDLLQIARGRNLVIKNPDALQPDARSRRATASARQPVAGPFAAADGPAVAEALVQHSAADKPAYRATFTGAVRIVRGQAEVARADELFIDFIFERSDAPVSSRRPPQRQAPVLPAIASVGPAPVILASGAAAQPAASEQPATQPVPVTILWTGPLVVTPLPDGAPRPAADAANVHMVGSPLQLMQDTSRVQARSLVYDTAAELLTLEASAAYPLVMDDGKGGSVESTSLDYSMQERTAIFRGKSRALLPLRDAGDAPPQALSAVWTDRCTLHLAGEGLESLVADRIELVGAVDVNHPSMKLKADSLDMRMNTAGNGLQPGGADGSQRMQLKEVIATGEVRCQVLDQQRNTQEISAERLKIATASDERGRLFVRRVDADGKVVASDPQQTFKAGHLTATLSPAPAGDGGDAAGAGKPAALAQRVDLEHFLAIDGAEYTSADGKRAAADQIEVLMKDGQPFITLLGEAKVSDGTNVLFGPHIQVSGSEQKATIVGPGSLEAQRQSAAGQPPRPVTVEWNKGVIADGKANRVDVSAGVVVTTSEPDGTSHAIQGDQLTMALEDAPAGPEKARDAEKARDGEKSAKGDRPLLQDKVVKTVTISGGTVVRSLRTAEDGVILRRFMLRADMLTYNLPQRTMTVPVAGQLLFEDHPARTTAAPKPDQDKLAGATAMKWDRRLAYDERAGTITLEGDVFINHEPDADQKQPAFTLEAQAVTAELDAAAADSTGAARADAAPAAEQTDPAGRELKRFIAERAVRFSARGIELAASRVEYDPTTGLMVATGNETHPVRIDRGLSTGSFRLARYNLHTNQLQVTDFRGNVR